jgi:hypothetical protein
VADLLDLRRFEGATLAPLGWNADAALATLLETVSVTPEIQSLLDADAAIGATPAAHSAAPSTGADGLAASDAALPGSAAEVAANPKFDDAASTVEVFSDTTDAPAAPASPDAIADLLIHATAGLAPSTHGGFSVPPDDRLTHQPELAVGA